MNLMNLLKGQLTPEMIAQMSQQTGATHQETATAEVAFKVTAPGPQCNPLIPAGDCGKGEIVA